ncbi:ATP-binding protein [Corynebacterium lizhenjunii]|uniref:ATP-binding protein n=1 Tax=Corynebacterium lizhenjunii TaxID=2709394 RepID=A0A7T0PBN1_9CORY|nr:ATP-binding protein [Corynebacterium lizhenjunii]QPK78897.1 ATP-binding protein [Corynebacterium lizhenjunii]
MLLSFTFGNWKSYQDQVEFSMLATREQKHGDRLARIRRSRVLPVGAIYGANAAGKSTLVGAIAALRDIVTGARRPTALLPVSPNQPHGTGQPSTFTVEFVAGVDTGNGTLKDQIFIYELTLDKRSIHHEALLIRRSTKEDFFFEREGQTVTLYGALESNSRVQAHASVVAPNATILGAIGSDQSVQDPYLHAAYEWFAKQLTVIYRSSQFIHLPARFDTDKLFAQAMNEGLTRADTGITALKLEEMKVDALPTEADVLDRLVEMLSDKGGTFVIGGDAGDYAVLDIEADQLRARRLVAEHAISIGPMEDPQTFTLNLRDESDGTQRFMNLLPVLFQLREEDARAVFLVDELESSMHPKLTEDFIRSFLEDLDGDARRQLIFTTHEVQLMRADLLRRDEIWLAEKVSGQSQLVRVSDFSDIGVRKDADLLSFYMSGRLGGVPRV